MINFCHITPTPHLDEIKNYPVHLLLAHLVEENEDYRRFYRNLKDENPDVFYHLDNSCYEMFSRGEPMYPSEKLIEMGNLVKADSIVLSDYPKEPWEKTVNAAKKLIPEFKNAGFKTFFCPQSEYADFLGYIKSLSWAIHNVNIDFIGISILGAPIAFGLDPAATDDCYKMQRFLSRWDMFNTMSELRLLNSNFTNKRFHLLGLLDGPREIKLLKPFHDYIFSWDSSSAFHHASCGIKYDGSPTGLRFGKNMGEFDFDFKADKDVLTIAQYNRNFIDEMIGYVV